MLRKINSASGICTLEISGALPERFLNSCAAAGLEIISAERVADYLVRVRIPDSQRKAAEALAVKSQCEVLKRKSTGLFLWAGILRRRMCAAVLGTLVVALLFWSKFFVWEISVSGNETVRTGEILDALAACGVESGSFWPDFSPENIRSQVLVLLPELSWLTVNMRGSLAEVTVVERTEIPEMVFDGAPADIVAEKDGFITGISALVGTAMTERGSAVTKGDILISGAVESSFAQPRFLRSYGSVTAETYREMTAVSPEIVSVKRYTGREKSKFALIIGDKRINFYSDSSISDTLCDKIISVWKAKVEGLFSMPISIVRVTEHCYELETLGADSFDVAVKLESVLDHALLADIGDGEIISRDISFSSKDGLIYACLRAKCEEEIGTLQEMSQERIGYINYLHQQKADESNDGTQN